MRRRFGVLDLFLWTFGSSLGLIVSFQLLEALAPGATTDLVSLGAMEALVYGIVCFAVWHLYGSARPARGFLGIRGTHPLFSVLGLGLGVTLQAPADALQYLVELVAGPTPEQQLMSRALLMRADSELSAMMMMLSTACLVPLVEELVFRGAFFGALKVETAPLRAGIFTGLAFVICHADFRVWLPLGMVALVLSLLRVVSGSVLPGFALHLSFNAVTLTLVVMKLVPVDQRLGLPWSVSALGFGLSVLLIYGVVWVARSEPAALARAEDDA